jgi:RNase H-like domain found in reverse transcriptase
VLVFFDDILVYSKDLPTHVHHLTKVLDKLVTHELKAKWSKCIFGVDNVEYLGHIINSEGVNTDPCKVEAMQQWLVPKTLKVLRGFLGLTGYYRKFIKNYGVINKPLTDLLKKNGFHWGPEASTTFQTLKRAMCTAPVLALPDFTQPFTLKTDTSDKGMGAILMQKGRPITFLSKALGMKNQHLSTYKKELLTLLTVVTKWRHYLQGQPFVIKTDHISLKYLLEQRLNHTLQYNGLCKLLGLDYVIQYKKGVDNKMADALSRREIVQENSTHMAITEINHVWLEELKESYQGDKWTQDIIHKETTQQELPSQVKLHCGIIRKKGRIYVGSNAE